VKSELILLSAVASLAAVSPAFAEVRTFVASGIGYAVAQPDIVFLKIGFNSNGDTPEAALRADAENARRVTDVLLKQGLQANDLETEGYSIEQVMGPAGCGRVYGDEPPVECVLEGYVLNNSIAIRIRNIADYGTILTGAIAAGLKDIGNITFAVSDEQKYYDEAFAKALLAAKAKAELTARTLGFRLGPIVNVGANIAPERYSQERPATLNDGIAYNYGNEQADMVMLEPVANAGEMTFRREASIT